MSLNEAIIELENYSYLIGQKFKGSIVTNLIILPANGDLLIDIIKQEIFDNSYYHLIRDIKEFKIVGLLDLDRYLGTGVLLIESLEVIKNTINS